VCPAKREHVVFGIKGAQDLKGYPITRSCPGL
jgi:hypothetical protein